MNPLIPMQGVCDPHIHIFDGKAYLYATRDNWVPGAKNFQMTEWQIWSSEDLVHWRLEQVTDPKNFYCGPIDQCWAVDAAQRNGKYYWYYSVGAQAVGVGISDSPAGPFQEALGHPLAGPDTPPVGMNKWDPCVFVDDDGAAYLICGSCLGTDEYQIARLNEDMCSLAEPLRTIEYNGNICREDKASIHKENGIYYLSHASFYATSDNVYGPYTYRGNTTANIDHGCFFTFRGQTYHASGGMDNPSQYFRASFLTYCHYRKNGEVIVDQLPTGYGVGQYNASWDWIEARWHSGCQNAVKQERTDGSFDMALSGEGSWLSFPNVCHMARNMACNVIYSNCAEPVTLEIRRDAPDGALLGSCVLHAVEPGGEANTICQLSNEPGHHSLYLVIRGGDVVLKRFSLAGGKRRGSAEASRGKLLGSAQRQAWDGAAAGMAVRLEQPCDGVALLLDGGPGRETECVLRYSASQPASITLLLNEDPQTILLPQTGLSVGELCFSLNLQPGINRLTVHLGVGNRIPVVLDSLRTEAPGGIFRSYPAADGSLSQEGNGCWVGLPQREWDRNSYSGRCVNHLSTPGHSVTVSQIRGGLAGRETALMIRYGNGSDQPVRCRLEVNGNDCGILEFPPTGGINLEQAGVLTVPVQLSRDTNRITLAMESASTPGLCVDAFSVVPLPISESSEERDESKIETPRTNRNPGPLQ